MSCAGYLASSAPDVTSHPQPFRKRFSPGGRAQREHYPKYLAIFELETEETLRSPEYQEFLTNPTEWTRRIVPNVSIMALVYQQVYPEEDFFTR